MKDRAVIAWKGKPEPAQERLEAAVAIFRRLGARKDAVREGELAQVGDAPPGTAAVR